MTGDKVLYSSHEPSKPSLQNDRNKRPKRAQESDVNFYGYSVCRLPSVKSLCFGDDKMLPVTIIKAGWDHFYLPQR